MVFAEPNWRLAAAAVSNDPNDATGGGLWGMYGDDLPSASGPAGTTNAFGSQAEKAWDAGFTGSRSVVVGIGVAGVTWSTTLISTKFLGPTGGTTTAAIKAAAYEAVVAVAALTSTGGLASYSNYGATTVDIAAPGSGIVSTLPGGTYGSYSGTSMATPHVTGAMALYAAANANALDHVGLGAGKRGHLHVHRQPVRRERVAGEREVRHGQRHGEGRQDVGLHGHQRHADVQARRDDKDDCRRDSQ